MWHWKWKSSSARINLLKHYYKFQIKNQLLYCVLIVVFWSQVSIPFWFCFLFVCLSYWKLSPSLNSSKIHDSVRSAYWSFVINVTSFQPFSLISILLLRLALSPTSHPIDYVYQMGALAGDGRTIKTLSTTSSKILLL